MEDDVKQSSADRHAVSQAYRWRAERDKARQELRQLKERSRDTTTSAYDLMPEEDREALAWVREHGGLDIVKKLLDWVVGHCSTKQQLDFDFWLSGRVMYELGFDEDMADRDEVERRLLARLMPEGYEWPRYESGEPLRYEDRYVYDGREREVWHVDFDSYGEPTILNKDGTRCQPDKGERVERPAPKVLDADGAEIRVGDVLYSVKTGDYVTVGSIEPGNPWFATTDGTLQHCAKFTHRAPVFAADGMPLREGEHVYHVETGAELVVKELPKPGEYQAVVVFAPPASHPTSFDPNLLTHRAPVLAADGRPLEVGQTVYYTDTGREYQIHSISDDGKGAFVYNNSLGQDAAGLHLCPVGKLTHTKPEIDSWEKLEQDAEKDPCGYFGFDGEEPCGKCPASGKNCEQTMALDIVRRARALAERGE